MVIPQRDVTGGNLSVLSLQEALGLCTQVNQVVNIFSLVGDFHICKIIQEVGTKYYYPSTLERS